MPGTGLKSKLRTARVEYLAVEKNAVELLGKGHTLRSAHSALKDAGKITMSYDTFRRYALGLCGTKRLRKEPANDKAKAASSPSLTSARPPESEKKEPKTVSASPAKTSDSMSQKRGPIIVRAEQKGFGQDKISLEDLI